MQTQSRLKSRPNSRLSQESFVGLKPLGIAKRRDGYIYVPRNIIFSKPSPLIVMLHGAGGCGKNAILPLQELADHTQTILLAPDSRSVTWDFILEGYGPDVEFINQALSQVFSCFLIDEKHLGIAGFSDGASYALSLGMANGDLFSHILAFSPGWIAPDLHPDSPPIFISHGKADTVLDINHCSRPLFELLKKSKFNVSFKEFSGGHAVPESIVQEAFVWFLNAKSKKRDFDSLIPIIPSELEILH